MRAHLAELGLVAQKGREGVQQLMRTVADAERRPRVKGFFGFQLAVGCKSCVRPVCAAHMAAGPDVIRRSGPNQKPALDSA
jgi:hypothetical protein